MTRLIERRLPKKTNRYFYELALEQPNFSDTIERKKPWSFCKNNNE